MKNIYILGLTIFALISTKAQLNSVIINNNTSYYLTGRLEAKGVQDCEIRLYSAVIVPPYSSVTYNKFYNSNLSTIPINSYVVSTLPTGNNSIAYNDLLLSANGFLSNNTDWSRYNFSTGTGSGNSIDSFNVGIADFSCGYMPLTIHYGNYSTAEWTSTVNGGVFYHVINVY